MTSWPVGKGYKREARRPGGSVDQGAIGSPCDWRCGGKGRAENRSMDKSKARLILRFLLVALFGLIVLSIGIAFVADKLLPEALADWVKQENSGEIGIADIIGLLFWGAGLFLFFVSMVGLFCYQRWAAWMMAGEIGRAHV